MAEIDFGHVISPEEAQLSLDPTQDSQSDDRVISNGNLTWEYHNMGRINGVRVADDDIALPIETDELIDGAFELRRTPRSKIFWMSPEDADSIKLYDDLLALQEDCEIQILEEIKQYDAAKSKFMVWLRYDELRYELKPRYAYLREEIR